MFPAKFLWGSVLLRGELQKYANNSNFENFQSALYSTSVSMPLNKNNIGAGESNQKRKNTNLTYKWKSSCECNKVVSAFLAKMSF